MQQHRSETPSSASPAAADNSRRANALIWFAVILILAGCVLSFAVYRSNRGNQTPAGALPASDQAVVSPEVAKVYTSPSAASPANTHKPKPSATIPDAGSLPVDEQDPLVEQQGPDPVGGDDTPEGRRERKRREAEIEALLKVANDVTAPNRVKALQSLLSYSTADNPAIVEVLHSALQDPDFAVVACAIQEIAGRDDAEALKAMASTLRDGDLSTKLLLVESITSNMAARSILEQGLSDADEEVRDAAKAALYASAMTEEKPVH